MQPTVQAKMFKTAILVTGSPLDESAQVPLAMEQALHLVPLLGKCALVHVLEAMTAAGVERLICMGWQNPDRARHMLGDGQRWGIALEWVTVQGPEEVFQKISEQSVTADEWVLLGSTNTLLDIRHMPVPVSGCAYRLKANPDAWPWMVLNKPTLQQASVCQWRDWPKLPDQLGLKAIEVPGLSLQSGHDLLAAIGPMLKDDLPVVVPASQVEPGIYISRNVVIHPTVVIQGPVYIGEDVYLEKGCLVHAGTAIGKQCRIGENTTLSNSIIGPESWLGSDLECNQMVIWRGVAWSNRWKAEIEIRDTVLLDSGTWHLTLQRSLTEGFSFLSATLLLLLTWPVMPVLLLLAAGNNPLQRRPYVFPERSHLHQPSRNIWCLFGAGPGTRGWKHLLGYVIPNLHLVVCGKLRLTGMRLRTPQEWNASPPEVQKWLSRRSAGLVQEEWLNDPHSGDWLASIVQDRYQVARGRSLRYQLHLLWRYFFKLTTGTHEPSRR